jgi:hypothetical protein
MSKRLLISFFLAIVLTAVGTLFSFLSFHGPAVFKYASYLFLPLYIFPERYVEMLARISHAAFFAELALIRHKSNGLAGRECIKRLEFERRFF